ncbi:MAG: TlpA family protein disulfide reductase [Holophagales bacterium]|nr:TlpA family protein disulfide reductase [Holophagales bacterium]
MTYRAHWLLAPCLLLSFGALAAPADETRGMGCRPVTLPFDGEVAIRPPEVEACVEFQIVKAGLLLFGGVPAGLDGELVIERTVEGEDEPASLAGFAISGGGEGRAGAVRVTSGRYRAVVRGRPWAPASVIRVTLSERPWRPGGWRELLSTSGKIEAGNGVVSARERKTVSGVVLERAGAWESVSHVEVMRDEASGAVLVPRTASGVFPREARAGGAESDWRTWSDLPSEGVLLSFPSADLGDSGVALRGVSPGPVIRADEVAGAIDPDAPMGRTLGRPGYALDLHLVEPTDLRARVDSPDGPVIVRFRDENGTLLAEDDRGDASAEAWIAAEALAVPARGRNLRVEILLRDDRGKRCSFDVEGTKRGSLTLRPAGELRLDAKGAGLRRRARLFEGECRRPCRIRLTTPESVPSAVLRADGSFEAVSRAAVPADLLRVGDAAVVRSLSAASDESILHRHGVDRPDDLEEGARGVIRMFQGREFAGLQTSGSELEGVATAGLAPEGYGGPERFQLLDFTAGASGPLLFALFDDSAAVPQVEVIETLFRERASREKSSLEPLVEYLPGWMEAVSEVEVTEPGLLEAEIPDPEGRFEFSLWDPAGKRIARSRPASDVGCSWGCPHSADGECDDGRPGAVSASCPPGTDCADCLAIPRARPASPVLELRKWLPAPGRYRLRIAAARIPKGSIPYSLRWKHRSGTPLERVVRPAEVGQIAAFFETTRPTWRRRVRTDAGRETLVELELPSALPARLELLDEGGKRLAVTDSGASAPSVVALLPPGPDREIEIVASTATSVPSASLTVFSLSQPLGVVKPKRLAPRPETRPPAPQVELPTGAALPASLQALRGKVVVLEFWASWCAPCREALPAVERLHRTFGGRDVVVLGLNSEAAPVRGRAVSELGLTFPQVPDEDERIWALFAVEELPRTIVVDRSGRVFADLKGLLPPGRLRALVELALAEPAS